MTTRHGRKSSIRRRMSRTGGSYTEAARAVAAERARETLPPAADELAGQHRDLSEPAGAVVRACQKCGRELVASAVVGAICVFCAMPATVDAAPPPPRHHLALPSLTTQHHGHPQAVHADQPHTDAEVPELPAQPPPFVGVLRAARAPYVPARRGSRVSAPVLVPTPPPPPPGNGSIAVRAQYAVIARQFAQRGGRYAAPPRSEE